MSFTNQSYQSPTPKNYVRNSQAPTPTAAVGGQQQFQNPSNSQQQIFADASQSQIIQTNQGVLGQSNISPNKNAISRLQTSNQYYQSPENGQLNMNPRIVYLRKLYLALFFQLSFIGSFAYLLYEIPDVHTHLKDNLIYLWISLGVTILIGIIGIVSRPSIQKFPSNVLTMLIWTLAFGMVLIYASSIAVSAVTGIMLFSLLTALVLGQFIYTLTVRYELTYQGSTLFVFGISVLIFHGFTLFSELSFFTMLFVTLAALVFVFYLIFDTQSYVAAGPNYDQNHEEWKSGIVLVYLDIFMLVLRLADLSKTMINRRYD